MRVAAVTMAIWVLTLLTHRWLSRHPDWDLPTDQGFRLAVATGRFVLPIVAVLAVITGQP